MTKPIPPPEWAIERAREALRKVGWPPFPRTLEFVAAALVAVRRETIEECAQIALTWRDEADANQHPDAGDPNHSLGQGYAANRIAVHIRALADKEPT